MKRIIVFLSIKPSLLVGSIVAVFFLLTVFWRVSIYSPSFDIANIDATYHTLLTMKSLEQGDTVDHLFLPTVTLSENNAEKYIPWGSTIPDDKGNYYYTSFPQLGFVVPLLLLKTFHAEISTINLMYVNFFIEAVTIALLMVFIFRIYRDMKANSSTEAVYFSGLIALVYMFSLEVFYSQGIIYWAQSLMQPILIGQFIAVYAISRSVKFKAHLAAILSLLIFSGVLTEWTGYMSALGIILYFAYRRVRSRVFPSVMYILLSMAAVIIGSAVYLMPFIIITNFHQYLAVSAQRFTARGSSVGVGPTLEQLGLSYVESFGPIIVVIVAAIVMLYADKSSWIILRATMRRYRYLVLLTTVPLIENLVMKQHAYQYSFDRLKLFIPLAVLSVIIFTSARSFAMKSILLIALVLCIPVSITQINQSSRTVLYASYSETKSFISELKREYPNASFSFNGPVRGWLNLHIGTNIHESVTDYHKFKQDCTRKTCVWLVGALRGTAQYNIYGAYVFNAETQDVKVIGEPRCNYCNNAPAI